MSTLFATPRGGSDYLIQNMICRKVLRIIVTLSKDAYQRKVFVSGAGCPGDFSSGACARGYGSAIPSVSLDRGRRSRQIRRLTRCSGLLRGATGCRFFLSSTLYCCRSTWWLPMKTLPNGTRGKVACVAAFKGCPGVMCVGAGD